MNLNFIKTMFQEVLTNLDDVRVTRIKALIDALAGEMPFFIQLTAEERKAANSVAEGRLPMVQAGARASSKYHEKLGLPTNESIQLKRMAYDFTALSEIKEQLEVVMEGLNDTTMRIGSNCYEQVLIVRDLAAVAIRRGVPGMETVFAELSQPFERSSKPKSAPEGTGGTGEPLVPGDE